MRMTLAGWEMKSLDSSVGRFLALARGEDLVGVDLDALGGLVLSPLQCARSARRSSTSGVAGAYVDWTREGLDAR